jgi:hypothetical protein
MVALLKRLGYDLYGYALPPKGNRAKLVESLRIAQPGSGDPTWRRRRLCGEVMLSRSNVGFGIGRRV